MVIKESKRTALADFRKLPERETAQRVGWRL
jgi:hypothetical protein